MEADLPLNEPERLAVLKRLNILDTPLEERFNRITRMVCRSLNVPISAVSLVDESRQWFKSIEGLNVSETPREVAFCAHAILDDELFVVEDATQDPRFADNPLVTEEPYIRFYAGYPLSIAQDIRIGTLCAIDRQPRDLSPEESETLQDLAKMVESELTAIALSEAQIELIQQLSQLERLAMIDRLTRVWNRLGIETLLHREWDHAQRKGLEIAIVMLDFDDFKQINDTYGHFIGDEVLQGGARLLLTLLRSYDAVGRWGGDEFMLIFPGMNQAEATLALTRILKVIHETPIVTSKGTIPIQASMGGVVAAPTQNETIEAWLEQADDLLLQVKRSSKGQFRLVAS